MNKKELRKIIREELLKEANKSNLNEGLLEKLLMVFLSPLIRREVKKIKNDPEIKAAEQSVQYAIDQYNNAVKREIEFHKAERKRRQKEHENLLNSLSTRKIQKK